MIIEHTARDGEARADPKLGLLLARCDRLRFDGGPLLSERSGHRRILTRATSVAIDPERTLTPTAATNKIIGPRQAPGASKQFATQVRPFMRLSRC